MSVTADPAASRVFRDELTSTTSVIAERLIGASPAAIRTYGLALGDLTFYVDNSLSYLAEAVAIGDPQVFERQLAWEAHMLVRHGLPAFLVENNVAIMLTEAATALRRAGYADAEAFVEAAAPDLSSVGHVPEPRSPLLEEGPGAELSRAFLERLEAYDREGASALIVDAASSGMSIRSLYLDVLQRVQWEVGRRWEIGAMSVAHEHYVTGVTQLTIARLYPFIMKTPRAGRLLVAMCVGSELHEIGLRMVCDLCELDGWDTRFLGANLPASAAEAIVRETRPDALAVSMTMLAHRRRLETLVAALRRAAKPGTPILVGGYPFAHVTDLWKRVGADATGATADDVVNLLN